MTKRLFPSQWMLPDHELFYDATLRFMMKEWAPRDEAWRRSGSVESEIWRQAGAAHLLCASIPVEYGGGGGDFGHEAVLVLAQAAAHVSGFSGALHSGVVAHYILAYGAEDQKQKWLPGLATGDFVGAIALTEPGAGSDLQAIQMTATKVDRGYRLNGQKTFVTNGGHANLVIVACKVISGSVGGLSLFVVETDASSGFHRGKNLEKIGTDAQEAVELFFDDCVVPDFSLVGGAEGVGLMQLLQQLPQERLLIAVGGVAAMEVALDETIRYTKQRIAFGKPLLAHQNTRFVLAECHASLLASRALVDAGITAHLTGSLGVDQASLIKYLVTEQQFEVVDKCLQMFGGYGYMKESLIARLWTDARVQRIYGGSNEIMKEIAARFL